MNKSDVKIAGSTCNLRPILFTLSTGEVGGICSVAVKCVDIWKNTGGEGDLLDDD